MAPAPAGVASRLAPRLLTALRSILHAGLGYFDRSDGFGRIAWPWLRDVSGIVGECHGHSIPRQDPPKHPIPTRYGSERRPAPDSGTAGDALIITRLGEAIGSDV